MTVYGPTSAHEPTWISISGGKIYMTPDGEATTVTIEPDNINIVGLPTTASNTGDIWRDTNGFLRIVP
jgi:hypothetical protein